MNRPINHNVVLLGAQAGGFAGGIYGGVKGAQMGWRYRRRDGGGITTSSLYGIGGFIGGQAVGGLAGGLAGAGVGLAGNLAFNGIRGLKP